MGWAVEDERRLARKTSVIRATISVYAVARGDSVPSVYKF
jgi:hypothetical protein